MHSEIIVMMAVLNLSATVQYNVYCIVFISRQLVIHAAQLAPSATTVRVLCRIAPKSRDTHPDDNLTKCVETTSPA